MQDVNNSNRVLPARRLTLLASVAALGFAVAVGAPAARGLTNPLSTAAHAAEIAPAAGFADLVAKVKPAVISVRVKMENNVSADAGSQLNVPPGLEKFFQQFGGETMPGHR